ncbi:YjbH domain-containing protein [Profundibacter sp.]
MTRTRKDNVKIPKQSQARALGKASAVFIACSCWILPAYAQSQGYSYSLYGTPGLIDMPTAQSAEDGELAQTFSTFDGQARATLTFQLTPRLSASFRYATLDNFSVTGERTWDRSFDFRYRLIDEGRYRPAIAIGLQDFMGTGLFSAEYIVATKSIGDRLSVTGGIGWGRLGSYNGFSNPLGRLNSGFYTRPGFSGLGGEPNTNAWFRGDAAFFGGVSWAANDRLTLKLEYSSDAYITESTRGLPADRFVHRSPVNFGLNYRLRPGVDLSASYLYGSVFSVGASFRFNPKHPPAKGSLGRGPVPVKPRISRNVSPADWGTGWIVDDARTARIENILSQLLAAEGMELEALEMSGTTARVRIRNNRYEAMPQAIGRTARLLTQVMPASVEVFKIEPVVNGMVPSVTTVRRSDMETLENTSDSAWLSYARAQIDPSSPAEGPQSRPDLYPRLTWGLSPYMDVSFFDPDQPLRADFGAELSGRYEIARGLSLSGALRQPIVGNLDSGRAAGSVLPHVRTDANLYAKADGPLLDHLTLDYYYQPAKNLYGRFTVGYLEKMYGGVSSEILWKPVDSRLAFGLEVNYAKKRDFDQLFGFQDYDVFTGHASAYYAFGNGFHGQLDVGRYLAGDWGATISLDREFRNGWKVGAFATFTNVSFEDFGEGSFDKGIKLTIPISWVTGQPTRRTAVTTIRPLTRDGGARLNVNGRLYETVRELHDPDLKSRWGRFWR